MKSIRNNYSSKDRMKHTGERYESSWNDVAIEGEIKNAKNNISMPKFKLDKIEVHPSGMCNLSCSFCYGQKIIPARRNTFLNTMVLENNVLNAIKEMPDHQNPLIIYAGLFGEPLLHPDIKEIIEKTANLGFKFGLYTNGIKLTQDLADSLVQSAKKNKNKEEEPSYVTFNITALINTDGKFSCELNNVLGKIKYLSEKTLQEDNPLVINASILAIKDFREDIYYDLVDKLKDINTNIRFSFPWKPQLNETNTGLTQLDYQRAKNMFSSIVSTYKDKITIRHPAKDFERCFVGVQALSISCEGNVFFCPEVSAPSFRNTHSYGSIYANKISEIWQSKQHQELFLKFDPYVSENLCVCCHMDNVFNRYCQKIYSSVTKHSLCNAAFAENSE